MILHSKRNRKQVKELINSLRSLRDRHEYWKNEFIELVGEQGFSELTKIYNQAIDKLIQEKKSLPVGYRYTGRFYIKKPYSIPVQYEMIDGAAFMREDLISWRIEAEHFYKDSYFRAIYKDASGKESSQIKREDSKPLYEVEG